MLDAKSKAILKTLVEMCSDDDFRILEVVDILSFIPKNFNCNKDNVKSILNCLEKGSFISIKYFDEEVVCLCVQNSARQIFENDIINRSKKKKTFKFILGSYISGLIIAFLGCFLAIMMYNLIF